MDSTQTYHALAQSRPRIRRDVLYTQTPEGVLFHNAQTGFHLKAASAYRFSSLIVPHLNGERAVADICEGFSEGNRALVAELVRSLYQRGFARDVPATVAPPTISAPIALRFAPQIAYVDHHVDDAERRFGQFRSTRVAILGADLIARWCAMSLVRNGSATIGVLRELDGKHTGFDSVRAEATTLTDNGCAVDIVTLSAAPGVVGWRDLDGYDLVVVTPGPGGPAQLLALLTEGVPPGRTLLPAWRFGGSAVIGPMTRADRPGCWMCAALRLAANGDNGDAADLWSNIAVPTSGLHDAPSRPLAAMIGNLLGYEIFRITTGVLPAETDGRVIVQDLASLDVVAEPLLPHPRCPFCSGQPVQSAAAALSIRDRSATLDDAAAHSQELATELLKELDGLSPLIQPHTGPIRQFTDEPLTQTPLKVGTVDIAVGHAVRREIAAFDVHTVVGARLRAVHTAAAVYAEHVAPDPTTLDPIEVGLLHSDSRPVRPGQLDIASGLIAGTDDIEHWTVATSLLTDDRVLVPAAAARPFGAHNNDRPFVRTSAGTGAGSSLADAAARGLLSALGYRALLSAVRGQARVQSVALDSLDADAELKFLVRSAGNLKLETELLDIGPEGGPSAHVVLARAVDPATGRWVWAVGSRPQWRSAAIAALRDLVGVVQLGTDPARAGTTVDTGDRLLFDLEPSALAVHSERPAAIGAASSWQQITANLRRTGTDALVLPTTPADLERAGVHTVRVLLASVDGHAR